MKADCTAHCRFFSAEDACRLALKAYVRAGRYIEPPPGEPWMVDGAPYAGPEVFYDGFVGEMRALLGLLSLQRRGKFEVGDSDLDPYVLAAEISPVKMAWVMIARERENARIEAEFSGPLRNDLPPADNGLHNQPAKGVERAG